MRKGLILVCLKADKDRGGNSPVGEGHLGEQPASECSRVRAADVCTAYNSMFRERKRRRDRRPPVDSRDATMVDGN